MNKSLKIRMEQENLKLVSVDLFSGPGGICTGFKWGGILPLIAVEWTDSTVQTYSITHDAEVFELSEYEKDNTYIDNFLHESTKTILIHGDINLVSAEMISGFLDKRYGIDCVNQTVSSVVV